MYVIGLNKSHGPEDEVHVVVIYIFPVKVKFYFSCVFCYFASTEWLSITSKSPAILKFLLQDTGADMMEKALKPLSLPKKKTLVFNDAAKF